ncbi:MAG: hypothetical protein IJ689_02470 [Alphaproteobacteria bacterium]|nr:hypothetical protein [Alphaproteobacteria bacterium]
MNKYILLLSIAGVALGSYAAYADNSATMTVTATINHDVSLAVTQDLDLGTITINPAGGDTEWRYDTSGNFDFIGDGGAVIAADNATVGTFTANIPNPEACDGKNWACGGLKLSGNWTNGYIRNIFGGSDNSNHCYFHIKYTGDSNVFNVLTPYCWVEDGTSAVPGSHSGTLTISYTAS